MSQLPVRARLGRGGWSRHRCVVSCAGGAAGASDTRDQHHTVEELLLELSARRAAAVRVDADAQPRPQPYHADPIRHSVAGGLLDAPEHEGQSVDGAAARYGRFLLAAAIVGVV